MSILYCLTSFIGYVTPRPGTFRFRRTLASFVTLNIIWFFFDAGFDKGFSLFFTEVYFVVEVPMKLNISAI